MRSCPVVRKHTRDIKEEKTTKNGIFEFIYFETE